MREDTYSGSTKAEQARLAWDRAIKLLKEHGMKEVAARRFFGRLISANGLTGDLMLSAVDRCIEIGTQDPQGYLTRAAAGIRSRNSNPGLMASWT